MKAMGIAPLLAGAMLREQIGGKYDIYFQETRVSDTTEELRKRGLDWKEDQMEIIAWRVQEKVGNLLVGEKN